MEQHLLHVAHQYFSSFPVANLSWKYRRGVRLYRLSPVLKSVDQPNAKHLQQPLLQHFTRLKDVTYISQELAQLLHMKKWTIDSEALLKQMKPFTVLA